MKILHIAPTPFFADRGCHPRILGEIAHLQHAGHDVVLVTYHIGRDLEGISTRRIPTVPWYHKLEAGASWHKFYLDALLLWTALKTARRRKPAVIHGHLHEGALIGWAVSLLASARRIPVVFDVQGSLSGELEAYGFVKKNSFLKAVFAGIEKLICRLPDYLVCSSGANTQFIRRQVHQSLHDVRRFRTTSTAIGINPDSVGQRTIKLGIYCGDLVKTR